LLFLALLAAGLNSGLAAPAALHDEGHAAPPGPRQDASEWPGRIVTIIDRGPATAACR